MSTENQEQPKVSLKCIKCNQPLMKPSAQVKEFIGLVCGNEKCERFGLLSVVGKSEKIEDSKIVLPGESK